MATASDLLFAFEAMAKNTGVRRLDVRTARSLAARLSSDRAILSECGITVNVIDQHKRTNGYEFLVT